MAMQNETNAKREIDRLSGVETTGHEWDGLKELNNPMPRWWLWVFVLTIIWAVGYWVIYPSWPTLSGQGARGGVPGFAGWTQYKQLKDRQAEITARRDRVGARFGDASFDDILGDAELYAFALAGGASAFKDNCATCHGTGGAGAKGFPNLNDDDWLWGGSIDAIYQTIAYGIRAEHDETRFSEMPAFGEILSRDEINAVTAFVYGLAHDLTAEQAALVNSGRVIYGEQCAVCHGDDARGMRDLGAPNLADTLWLYSEGDYNAIAAQVRNPSHGVMPNWGARLGEDTIRQLSIYVHSLGGGE